MAAILVHGANPFALFALLAILIILNNNLFVNKMQHDKIWLFQMVLSLVLFCHLFCFVFV